MRESLKYNACARMLELKVGSVLYTAGSAIALTGAVRKPVLPHAVTAGASLYIEQEYLITGKPDLISNWRFRLCFTP